MRNPAVIDDVTPTGLAATHALIRVRTTAAREFVDITSRVGAVLSDARIAHGIANVQTRHTTTAIVVNENEPLLLADMADALERLAPAERAYRHDDPFKRRVNVVPGERRNGHAHCQALALRASECLNVIDGRLCLGRWQRIFLVELDGAQAREVSVMIVGVSREPPSRPIVLDRPEGWAAVRLG